MKRKAIDKARGRLAMARADFVSLRAARNFSAFQPAWYKFLVSANAIDMILQSNAISPSDKPWYGGKVHLRRTDPLLAYMHAARNADEHGLEPVVAHDPGHFFIGAPGEAVSIKSLFWIRGQPLKIQFDPSKPLATIGGSFPHPKLITVIDERFGNRFDPPISHLGKAINGNDPLAVATLWLSYLENLIDEAASRPE